MKMVKRMKGSSIAKILLGIIERHEKFQGSYFWKSPSHASARRQMEEKESNTIEFGYKGHEYIVSQSVTCSCSNVYYSLRIMVDGERKDIRAIKYLLE
jgi:hypothetical protein